MLFACIAHGGGARGDVKFAVERDQVVINGARTDDETCGDLGIAQALGQQAQHIEFSPGQPDMDRRGRRRRRGDGDRGKQFRDGVPCGKRLLWRHAAPLGPCLSKSLLTDLRARVRKRSLVTGTIDRVHGRADGLAQALCCSPEPCRVAWLVLCCLYDGQALQTCRDLFFEKVVFEQQRQALPVEAPSRGYIALQGQEPRQAETQLDGVRLYAHLFSECQALFHTETLRL